MAKVRDNQTGQIIDVPDEQLGNYGLSKQPATTTQPTAAVQQPVVTPTAPLMQGGQTATKTDTQPPTITGHSLQEHATALQAAQAAGDTAGAKQIKDMYDREYQYQKDMVLPGQTKEADKKEKIDTAKGDAKSLIEATLQNYLNVPADQKGQIEGNKANIPILNGMIAPQATEYEAGLKGEAPALGKVFGGAGSGLRITQAELNSWTPFLPSIHKTDDQNKADVQKLNVIMQGRFGTGLDPEIMKQYGLDEKGNAPKASTEPGVAERLAKGAVGDVGDAVKGVAQTGMDFAHKIAPTIQDGKITKMGEPLPSAAGDIITGMGKGLVNEYGQLIGAKTADGKPILDPNKSVFQKGGVDLPNKMDVGSAVNHAVDHPVNTLLDLVPFLKAADALKAGSTAGEAANGAKVAQGMDVASAVKTGDTLNPLQKAIAGAGDLVNGGGSKEYIAQNATKEGAIPQSQVLMEENILSHPTETGRIKATANAMKKHGTALQDAYNSSDRVFKGSELGDLLDSKLGEMGYDPKAVKFIKGYINQQGQFDLHSGENLITMDKGWKTAKTLENNPPKILKNPESAAAYKKLSGDAARVIRGELASKVPETIPLNQRYSALRDYFDNTLSDPQGLSLNGGHGKGITGAAVDAGKSIINPILNTGFNVSDALASPTKLLRDKRMKVDNPSAFRPAH